MSRVTVTVTGGVTITDWGRLHYCNRKFNVEFSCRDLSGLTVRVRPASSECRDGTVRALNGRHCAKVIITESVTANHFANFDSG